MNYKFSNEFEKVIANVKDRYSVPLTSEKVLYGILSYECKALSIIESVDGINLIKIQSDLHQTIINGNHSNNSNSEYVGSILFVLNAIQNQQNEIDSLSFLNQIFSVDCIGKSILERNGLSKTKLKHPIIKAKKAKSKSEFFYDLTNLAHQKKLDNIVGREEEIKRCITILSRRLKNNPLLVGKPGVGKTAIVEGLANKIAAGQVPNNLKNKKIVVLEIGKLVAGTKYRGEFEEKLYKFLQDIQEDGHTIVFIDEIHTIMGTGAAEGGIDAGNILKPALARGDIKFIGATTFDEYKFLQADKALERRFQLIKIHEPTIEEMKKMARTIKFTYEQFHNKVYKDHVLDYAIDLAEQFIPNRCFPDKFIDVIDEAGVISTSTTVTIHDIGKAVESISGHLLVNQGKFNNSLNKDKIISDKFLPIQSEIKEILNMMDNNIYGLKYSYKVLGSILFQGKSFPIINELAIELSMNYNLSILRIDFDLLDLSQLHSHLFDPIQGVITNWIQRNSSSIIFFQNVKNDATSNIINKILSQGFILDQFGNYIDFSNTFIFTYCNSNTPGDIKAKFDKIFDLDNLPKDKYIDLLFTFVLNSMKQNLDISNDYLNKIKNLLYQKLSNVELESCHLQVTREVINRFLNSVQKDICWEQTKNGNVQFVN